MVPARLVVRVALTVVGGMAALACGFADVFRPAGPEAVTITYVGDTILWALSHARGRSARSDGHGAARERRRPAAATPDGARRGIRSRARAGAWRDGGGVQGDRGRAAARGGPQGAATRARPHGPRG